MGKSVKVTIKIDAETVKQAKEIGLNISKTSENALKSAIGKLSAPDGAVCANGDLVIRGGGPGRSRTCDPRHVKAMS